MKKTFQQGYSLVAVIITTVLITAGIVAGSIFFFQTYNNSEATNPALPSPSPTSALLTLNDVDPTAAASTKINGIIEGTFIFPSEFIPKTMKACAENIKTTVIICSPTLEETGLTNTFTLEIPAGQYHVYAVSGIEGQEDYRAYYTEFVTCGLLASCPSHEKITVEVAVGETTKDIKPHDWYDPSQGT